MDRERRQQGPRDAHTRLSSTYAFTPPVGPWLAALDHKRCPRHRHRQRMWAATGTVREADHQLSTSTSRVTMRMNTCRRRHRPWLTTTKRLILRKKTLPDSFARSKMSQVRKKALPLRAPPHEAARHGSSPWKQRWSRFTMSCVTSMGTHARIKPHVFGNRRSHPKSRHFLHRPISLMWKPICPWRSSSWKKSSVSNPRWRAPGTH